MGDRGNIAIITERNEHSIEQVCFYGHWAGHDMPMRLKDGLEAGRSRWNDAPYLARIIFCHLVPQSQWQETTSYGISTSIGDNEYLILVVDVPRQEVYTIRESELRQHKVPMDYKPESGWSFTGYIALGAELDGLNRGR